MNDNDTRYVEDRLRDATYAEARSVQRSDLRPLELDPAGRRSGSPPARRRAQWAVPVGAAAAVLVCAAAVVGTGVLGKHAGPQPSSGGPGIAPGAAGPTVPHYVTTKGGTFTVHSLTSGRVLDSARSSTGDRYVVAATTPDGRNYAVATYSDGCRNRLDLVVLDRQGHVARHGQAKVGIPRGMSVNAMATSADGTVAIELIACRGNTRQEVLIGNLRTGKSRVLSAPSRSKADIGGLSLSKDGRKLLYATTEMGPSPVLSYVYDTRSSGSRIGGTRLRFDQTAPGLTGKVQGGLILSPDGRSAVGAVSTGITAGSSGKRHYVGLVRYDLATGRPSVLYRWKVKGPDGLYLYSQDPSGRRFIVMRVSQKNAFSVVTEGHVTTLPGTRKLGDVSLVW